MCKKDSDTWRRLTQKSGKVHVVYADLRSLENVKQAAREILETGKPIDILVNNAAIFNATPGYHFKTEDKIEAQMQVNYVSHFALTGLLMPALERAKRPRVVNVSSFWAWRGDMASEGKLDFVNPTKAPSKAKQGYYDSKLANLIFTRELAKRYPGITSVATHPGAATTDLARPPVSFKFLYLYPHQAVNMPIAASVWPVESGKSYITPWLVMRGYPCNWFNGWWPRHAKNEALGEALWQASVRATGVDY